MAWKNSRNRSLIKVKEELIIKETNDAKIKIKITSIELNKNQRIKKTY